MKHGCRIMLFYKISILEESLTHLVLSLFEETWKTIEANNNSYVFALKISIGRVNHKYVMLKYCVLCAASCLISTFP